MMKIFKWHKHNYKKILYYTLSWESFGQRVSVFKRLQCSCGKHKTYRIHKNFVFDSDLNEELARLRGIGYVSIEEMEKIINEN